MTAHPASDQSRLRPARNRTPSWALLPAALAVLLLTGCAAQLEHRTAMGLLTEGKSAEAVEGLRRASAMDPGNAGYRVDYLHQRDALMQGILAAADAEREAGHMDAAVQRYREGARLEPGNERVKAGLALVEGERRAAIQLQAVERALKANQVDQALDLVKRLLRDAPRHPQGLATLRQIEERVQSERDVREEALAARAAFRRPVTLQFRDTPLRMVFEAIGKVGNVNVIVDKDVKPDLRTTIFVKDAAIEDALDVILMQNQLEKRVLSGNTLLIYPSNPAKQKELAELKVRTFQLTNIDVAFMANIVKTMVKTKDIVTDVKSNTLVIRETPEAIALVERLIAANDLPDAEVMLEVEVLEVSTTRASEIGLVLPTSFSVSTPNVSGTALTLGGLRALTRDTLNVSSMSATLNLMLQDGDTNILASPRIRSRNKEKAKILVGDKLPVITNLISPQQSGAANVVTGSIQYVEVGIKLEVEPQIYADGDVGIKLSLEVSNVTDTIQTESGRAYQIGTRSAQTTLRLHDGETQVMAGLINDTDRNSAKKIPGIGQLPMVGRIFQNNADNKAKSEIVLSITPRIIRPQAVADPRFADAWSGTENSLRDRPLRLDPLSVVKVSTPRPSVAPPAPRSGAAAPAPASTPLPAPAPAPAPAPVPAPAPAPESAPEAAAAAAQAQDGSDAPSAAPPATPPTAGTSPGGPPVTGLPLVTPRPMPGRKPMVPVAPAAEDATPKS